MDPSFPNLYGKHRSEPVPPKSHRLVADIDTALEQDVLDLAQRQRISNIHHHRQADDLGRTVEITEGISHPTTLRVGLPGINPVCSDKALAAHRGASCRRPATDSNPSLCVAGNTTL
jgi:hypothetical protein